MLKVPGNLSFSTQIQKESKRVYVASSCNKNCHLTCKMLRKMVEELLTKPVNLNPAFIQTYFKSVIKMNMRLYSFIFYISDLSGSNFIIELFSGRYCLPQTSWLYIQHYISNFTLLLLIAFISHVTSSSFLW